MQPIEMTTSLIQSPPYEQLCCMFERIEGVINKLFPKKRRLLRSVLEIAIRDKADRLIREPVADVLWDACWEIGRDAHG
jgi:hypothetical protein